MLYKLKTTHKQLSLFIGSQGVAYSKGLGNIVKNGVVTDEKKEIDRNTLLEVTAFNFETNKVRVRCIKELQYYEVEVGYKYILEKCAFESKDVTKPIEAVFVKYYIQNVLDRETALFILVMAMTYICGLFIGKVF